MNKAALLAELEHLAPRDRLEVAYGLLDSVLRDEGAPPLTDEQREEFRERLAYHRGQPDAPRVTLAEIRRRLTNL